MSFWRWWIVAMVVAQSWNLGATLLSRVIIVDSRSNGPHPLGSAAFLLPFASGALAINLLLIPPLLAYVRIWVVRVSPTTLSGFNAWGWFATVTWSSIHTVKPWRVPFLPAVRVYSSETNLVIWLPLFLVNYPQFARRVLEYAGPEHPLTQPVLFHLDPEESLP